jgi:flavodoxin I
MNVPFMMMILLMIGQMKTVTGFSVYPQNIIFSNLRPTTTTKTTTTTSLTATSSVGIFFGTSTGNTESVAYTLAQEFGTEPPIDIDSIQGSLADVFAKYNAIIVGTPTWNTGADTQRSGTGWDEVYYSELSKLSTVLTNKKVAVFGLGDSISYGSNYADGMGELHDVFQSLGCTMLGYVSQDGYEHEASKAIRGEVFCGLPLDNVNFEELTPKRIQNWVQQLKQEGIVSDLTTTRTSTIASTSSTTSSMDVSKWDEELEESSKLLQSTLKQEAIPTTAGLFQPHYNAVTGKTMWTSKDGRKCFYTTASNKASP